MMGLAAAAGAAAGCPPAPAVVSLPNATHSGYLPIGDDDGSGEEGSSLFYLFYEAQSREDAGAIPITLWLQVRSAGSSDPQSDHSGRCRRRRRLGFRCPPLPLPPAPAPLDHLGSHAPQGGPGCSSLFGAFYELGPELVGEDLSLRPNPGEWRRPRAGRAAGNSARRKRSAGCMQPRSRALPLRLQAHGTVGRRCCSSTSRRGWGSASRAARAASPETK